MSVFDHLFLDFDGTLVDSREGILKSLANCLASENIQPRVELTSRLIGPPLNVMLKTVVGADDPDTITKLEIAFRAEYDRDGYALTRAYAGVASVLVELRAIGVHLHVVTNKRRLPTLQIVEDLKWYSLFSSINTLDSSPNCLTKTEVVSMLLSELNAPLSRVALVGDSMDDALASERNGIRFGWASWGYGDAAKLKGFGLRLDDPGQILTLLLA